MPAPTLLQRLKQARAVQVLVAYLAASWVVLQLVDTLVGLLDLPPWVGPVAVVLLAIGLVVVMATAWIQSLPSTTAAEEAGELPTDWEIAPADALASLRSGRLPHLTWGRALMGGVMALSLLIGAAGLYVLVSGGRGLLGPAEAGAEASATAVAVLPFQTRGSDLDVYGEGMVDLLTTNLEGLGGLRTINAGTVVARWRSELGETLTAELPDALRVAGGLGARYAVRGSVVDAGGRVRLSAEIFDLADGGRVEGAQVEGDSDAMLELVDALTVRLATAFVGGTEGSAARGRAIDTGSLDAMEAYLRGEALYRGMRFVEAADAFAEATAADSLFALAWWRLSDAWGWVDPGAGPGQDALGRAQSLADRLPPRERLLLRADVALAAGSREPVADLRAHLARHDDDPEAWNLLAEYAVHAPHLSMSPPQEAYEATRRASELVPTFSPYYLHLAGLLINDQRGDDLQDLVRRMTAANPDDDLLDVWQVSWDYHWGTPAEMEAAEAFFAGEVGSRMNTVSLSFLSTDAADRTRAAVDRFTLALARQAFPYSATAIDVAAGVGPEGWRTSLPLAERAPAYVLWALLTGDADIGVAALRPTLERGPSTSEGTALAVLAALAGDDQLRDRALAALPDTGWAGPYGFYPGAASPDEAERTARAASHLRDGDAAGAADLMATSLAQPVYAAPAVYLMGEAQAALGDWRQAIHYWEVLFRGPFRPHVRLGLARAYEELGDTTDALEGYRGFLRMWRDAHADLAPVREAREGLARLGG